MIKILKDEMKYVINKYGINSIQAYNMCIRLAIENDKKFNNKTVQSYYNQSLEMLIEYIKQNDTNPNEIKWNKYALKNKLLSAESIGYIYGKGFNKMCKDIRKAIKNYQ